jgi:hypothetical protein
LTSPDVTAVSSFLLTRSTAESAEEEEEEAEGAEETLVL